MTRKRISDSVRWLRTRRRADGTRRLWWEPSADARALGFTVVEFDARHRHRAEREAAALNRQADAALASGQSRPVARDTMTVDMVVQDWQRSLHYTTRIAAATRNGYRVAANRIVRKWGEVPIADFTKKTINTWYESLFREAGPGSARVLITVFSMIFDHAETQDWRPENSNPCHGIARSGSGSRDRVITWGEYDALQAAAMACGLHSVGAAITLSMLQGQRQTDVLKATRGEFRQIDVRFPGQTADTSVWVWSMMRQKRKTAGDLPLHIEAVAVVQTLLDARILRDADPLITDERVGRGYDAHLFAKRFAEVRARAIADGCVSLASAQFRDLRRSFGVMARRGGASPADTGDVLGNSAASNPRLKDTYMPAEFYTAARAVMAVQRPLKPTDPERKAG